MKEIHFDNINIIEGKIEIKCTTSGDSLNLDDILFFDLSENVLVNENQLAVALSTLCGRVYDEIYMDLTIGKNIFEDIKKFTQSNIHLNGLSEDYQYPDFSENNIMLGFSGGFDSLAEYNLLRDADIFENLYLVSLDFQGSFSREEIFFKRFSPYVVKSNFVDLKLNRNHWSFMYIPQILYSNYLNSKYVAISGLLNAGIYGFDEKFSLNPNTDSVPISFLGMERLRFVQGLTDIGSALVDIYYTPELIDLSLKSLANPKDEKRYRKQLTIKVVSEKFNKRVFYEPVLEGRKLKWGTRIARDAMAIYFIKNAGIEEVSKIVEDIPKEAIELSESLSLEFFEKYNNNFLNKIPDKYQSKFLQTLISIGIYPYNSKDWEEFKIVSEFLSDYYPALKARLN